MGSKCNPLKLNSLLSEFVFLHLYLYHLEKLEAARSAYLWLPFLTFGYLSWPY